MTNPQRTKILQILYEERGDPLSKLDREELAQRIGRPWPELEPDVTYLEKKGYISTRTSHPRSRMYYLLRITPEGATFFENGAVEKEPPKVRRQLDVFISSPGDVTEERRVAKQVLDHCNRLSASMFLHFLAYEESVPAIIGARPQATVDQYMMQASLSDVFIGILAQRMGTPVIDEQTGERFRSGTEYEFLQAYRSNQRSGKPAILLYRGIKPPVGARDEEQWEQVQAFFLQFEGANALLKGLYKTFESKEQFAETLFDDLQILLSKHFT